MCEFHIDIRLSAQTSHWKCNLPIKSHCTNYLFCNMVHYVDTKAKIYKDVGTIETEGAINLSQLKNKQEDKREKRFATVNPTVIYLTHRILHLAFG